MVIFAISIYCMKFISQEFFPPSQRPELVVELTLPEGSSIKATEEQAEKLAAVLSEEQDKIDNFAYYTGQGSPRFVLTFDPVLPKDNYAQFVITAKDVEAREYLNQKLFKILNEDFPAVQSNIKFLQMGPPADYPVMIRVSGYDVDKVKI